MHIVNACWLLSALTGSVYTIEQYLRKCYVFLLYRIHKTVFLNKMCLWRCWRVLNSKQHSNISLFLSLLFLASERCGTSTCLVLILLIKSPIINYSLFWYMPLKLCLPSSFVMFGLYRFKFCGALYIQLLHTFIVRELVLLFYLFHLCSHFNNFLDNYVGWLFLIGSF